MNIGELRELLNKLPKAFDAIDVGIWDDDWKELIKLKDTLHLCHMKETVLVTFTWHDVEYRNTEAVLTKQLPLGSKQELLEFLGTDMKFDRFTDEETIKEVRDVVRDLRTAIQLEIEEEK